MTDPLSLVASIITVGTTAKGIGKILSKLQLLRNAPDELLALNNEVSDLTAALQSIESYISANKANGATLPQNTLLHISSLISRAKDRLFQLDQLIHYRFLKSGSLDENYKVFRLRWAKASKTVERHQLALRDIRQNIVIQLTAASSSAQSRICLAIDEVSVISREAQASVTTQVLRSDQAFHDLRTQSRLLAGISNDTAELRNVVQSTLSVSQTGDSAQYASQTSTHSPSTTSIIRIKAFIPAHRHSVCTYSCKCACHSQHQIRTPQLFNNILGNLFVGYSGYPFSTVQKCTNTICQRHSGLRAHIEYFFPFWLLKRMIHVLIMIAPTQEPCVSLTFRAVRPMSADVFKFTYIDDCQGLRRIFNNGSARPNDLMSVFETNAIMSAVTRNCLQACKLLLDAGADRHIQSNLSISPYTVAWDYILSASRENADLETLRSLFPDDGYYLEERQFSRLHKIILGIIHHSLEEDLIAGGVDIDVRDSTGNTPLSWAVQRQDTVAVDLLLKYKANPNIANNQGCTPFLYAATAMSPACLNLLLQAGADVSQTNSEGYNGLHFAIDGNGSLEIIKALISANLDIEGRTIGGHTPLASATSYKDKVGVMETLLDCGAGINSVDSEGNSPLLFTIWVGNDDAAQLLLSRGVNYTLVNHDRQTTLHTAATYGTLKMIEILQNANLVGVNPNARCTRGKTALQLAEEREFKPEGFMEMFRALHFTLCNRYDQQNHPPSGNAEASTPESTFHVVGAWPSDDEEPELDPEESFDAPEV